MTACEPEQEDISNGGHITVDQLREMSSVTLDKSSDGKDGNVVRCETHAPVNAYWDIRGKRFVGNFATKKMSAADLDVERIVKLTALCADGTQLEAEFPITVQTLTDPLKQYYIYGGPEHPEQKPFQPGAWVAADMRFSDTEGNHLPYLSDDIYWGFKTLIFDISGATDDCTAMVHNGWWSATYIESVPVTNGAWELAITKEMAQDCAKGNGGSGKDLQVLIRSGSCTVNSVFYEE